MSRRWLQFRLNTLLLVFTLSAVPLARFSAHARHQEAERRSIAAIEKAAGLQPGELPDLSDNWQMMTGKMGCQSDDDMSLEIAIEWRGASCLSGSMRWVGIPVCYHIRELSLTGYRFDDSLVEHLAACTSLKSLTLTDTAISPDGLRRLKQALPHTRIKSVESPPVVIDLSDWSSGRLSTY